MTENNPNRQTKDDIARDKLGPQGKPGERQQDKMTPQQDKNIPRSGEFDGHTA